MGCPCCKVQDCTIPLATVRQQFCPEHKAFEKECAVTNCTNQTEVGFRTCSIAMHRELEVHYHQQGKAMFQLKRRLERLKITQTHDSLPSARSMAEEQSRINVRIEGDVHITHLRPDDTIVSNEDDEDIFHPGEGPGDDEMTLDANGVCNGKPESGNRALRARFGRRRTHNEELCVASCGTILGRATFFGSEAPNGVRVCLT
jgi:hypothetical protein